MACFECTGEGPTLYDVEELDEAVARHPANPLQQRVDQIRAKARREPRVLTLRPKERASG